MIFALLRIGGVPPNILRGSWPWGGRYVDSPRGCGLNSDAVPSGYPPRKAIIDSLARGGGLRIPYVKSVTSQTQLDEHYWWGAPSSQPALPGAAWCQAG